MADSSSSSNISFSHCDAIWNDTGHRWHTLLSSETRAHPCYRRWSQLDVAVGAVWWNWVSLYRDLDICVGMHPHEIHLPSCCLVLSRGILTPPFLSKGARPDLNIGIILSVHPSHVSRLPPSRDPLFCTHILPPLIYHCYHDTQFMGVILLALILPCTLSRQTQRSPSPREQHFRVLSTLPTPFRGTEHLLPIFSANEKNPMELSVLSAP